ncbi:RNA polymerase factor sigma-54 [Treponema sp.]|uniref:RNA polymerase factor sigma-54 n=1 Tax=Treponema sp. TaxID=166 RepID=UPI003F116FD5
MTGFGLQQRQRASQIQRICQKQIQALKFLAMDSKNLTEEIYKAAEENPALVITKNRSSWDRTKTAVPTASGMAASENFQAALESKADERESLQDHLLGQLNSMRLSETEKSLCEKLIFNLDSKGFHILAPISLLDKKDKLQTPGLLEKCIETVRQLEPSGICVVNTEESLLVQARQRENAPPLALFILNGRFNFLDPPYPEKILQKIKAFIAKQKKLFADSNAEEYSTLNPTLRSVEEALGFIRTLDPLPARNFSSGEIHFIAPDVYIEKISGMAQQNQLEENTVSGSGGLWKIRLAQENIPQISLNPEFMQLAENKNQNSMEEELRKAKEFIGMLEFRQGTLLRACIEIAKIQTDFLLRGPGNLVPLRQKDIADKLSVHETTISRIANSKFIQCEWGLFDLKFFFTNAASSKNKNISKDKAMSELKKLLNSSSGKKMSDQKLSEELEKSGIKIARRTVAKYRNKLCIESSYNR